MNADAMKRAAGEAAADRVAIGMTIGLGTGSTATSFVRSLAERHLEITCVATSDATAVLARELGIRVVDLDAVSRIDLTVDGADEIGPRLTLIKGGGGALLREKLVWEASERCIVIADDSKRSARFGTHALPVEIVAYGHITTARRMARVLLNEGFEVEGVLRQVGNAPMLTDNCNMIYDIPFGEIAEPERIEAILKSITGVVEHGLFIDLASEALIATETGVVTLKP